MVGAYLPFRKGITYAALMSIIDQLKIMYLAGSSKYVVYRIMDTNLLMYNYHY